MISPPPSDRPLLGEILHLYQTGQAFAAARLVPHLMAQSVHANTTRRDRAAVLTELGRALHALGQPEAAVGCYQQALRVRPDDADTFNNLGAAFQGFGRMDQAETHYRRALSLRPDCAAAWINLHSCLYRPDDLEEAATCLERALTAAATPAAARFFLGCLRDRQGHGLEAARHFEALCGTPLGDYGMACWHFLNALPGGCPRLFGPTAEGLSLGLGAARRRGLVLEFGVRFGTSIRQLAAQAGQEVHGFDTFEGLPEAWLGLAAGSYSTQGHRPAVPPNVTLHAGLFEDSIPPFLADHRGPIRLINVDCDLYRSTRTVLDLCARRIAAGTVLIFDEYLAHPGWQADEHRALTEVAARQGWRCHYHAVSLFSKQAIVIID